MGTPAEREEQLAENDQRIAESLLAEAKYWDQQRTVAAQRYAEALEACKQVGLSNTLIARGVGKTEPAIRMFLKRRIQT